MNGPRLPMLLALLSVAFLAVAAITRSRAAEPPSHLSHVVIFALKDRSPAAREAFVASCRKYLAGHPGTLSFSVGTIAEDVVEPVSDRDFDVAVHLVFEGKAASDAYQKSHRHQEFVAENRASFAKVRVFDSYLAAP